MLPLEGECINVEEGPALEGEIIRYPSVSLSPTLSGNEKFEQYIRKKIHKPNVLRFWVEGEGEYINVEEGLTLEGEIVRYPSVSLSPTLSENEKVKKHIRKKTHKLNVLSFWIEGGVIPCVG